MGRSVSNAEAGWLWPPPGDIPDGPACGPGAPVGVCGTGFGPGPEPGVPGVPGATGRCCPPGGILSGVTPWAPGAVLGDPSPSSLFLVPAAVAAASAAPPPSRWLLLATSLMAGLIWRVSGVAPDLAGGGERETSTGVKGLTDSDVLARLPCSNQA